MECIEGEGLRCGEIEKERKTRRIGLKEKIRLWWGMIKEHGLRMAVQKSGSVEWRARWEGACRDDTHVHQEVKLWAPFSQLRIRQNF